MTATKTTRFDEVLREEIKYHKGCKGSSGKGEQWESGFIEGMKQAKDVFYQWRRIGKKSKEIV